MAGLAVNVPQRDRAGLRAIIEPGHLGDALGDLALGVAAGTQATQVALDIGGEHRHPGLAERLGQALQGYRLAGPGGPGDQTMAVGQAQVQAYGFTAGIGTEQYVSGIRHLAPLLLFNEAWGSVMPNRPVCRKNVRWNNFCGSR